MTTPSSPPTIGTAAGSGPGTDAELLSRFVKSGDGSAFSKLVERHLNLVFGVASRRTESRELAQEAAQNTFCQLARHAARVRVGKSLAPWLHKVALREAGTLLRSERSRQRTLQRLAVSVGGSESAAAQPAECPASSSVSRAGEHLDEALASLPEPERRVIILRYLQGLSLRELATAESSSEEAVRKRVSRALDRLTALLARQGVTASAMMGCLTHIPLWPVPPPAGIAARAAKEAAAASSTAGFAALAVSCLPAAAVFLAVPPCRGETPLLPSPARPPSPPLKTAR
ncbi:MAG: sigma-70 family RNA polymerase sigma factor [Verrucomicrobiota bacterium]